LVLCENILRSIKRVPCEIEQSIGVLKLFSVCPRKKTNIKLTDMDAMQEQIMKGKARGNPHRNKHATQQQQTNLL